nr:rhodanese-like domain-containing protein [Clostridia bacterium]
LGAQAVGFEGVEKRIDVIATAQRLRAKVQDLEELELNYAPPFSSAKDPVNMAGYTAENILAGNMDNITCAQLPDFKDAIILDVRTPGEVRMGAVPGCLNIPVDSLRERIGEIPTGKPVIVYCRVGIRAYIACRILMQNGFNEVYNLAGGYISYSTLNSDYTFKA